MSLDEYFSQLLYSYVIKLCSFLKISLAPFFCNQTPTAESMSHTEGNIQIFDSFIVIISSSTQYLRTEVKSSINLMLKVLKNDKFVWFLMHY